MFLENYKCSGKVYLIIRYSITNEVTETDVLNNIDDCVIIGIFSIIYVVAQFIGIYFNYFDRVGLFFAPFVVLLFERFGYGIKSVGMARVYFVATWCCFMLYFILGTTSSQYHYSFFF